LARAAARPDAVRDAGLHGVLQLAARGDAHERRRDRDVEPEGPAAPGTRRRLAVPAGRRHEPRHERLGARAHECVRAADRRSLMQDVRRLAVWILLLLATATLRAQTEWTRLDAPRVAIALA